MAALTRRLAAAAAVLLALPAARAQAPPDQPPAPAAPAAPVAAPTPTSQLDDAQAQFDATNSEKAIEIAQRVATALEAALPQAAPADLPELRRTLARAYDLLAQAYFSTSNRKAASDAAERLIKLLPTYAIDKKNADPRYVSFFDGKAQHLVGTLVLDCKPAACERVMIDGETVDVDRDGRVPLLAGKHALVLQRHNFRDYSAEAQVNAGERTPIAAQLEQVSRDLALVTIPPGVSVTLDGKVVGTTEPDADATKSKPFVVQNLEARTYVLVLEAPCRRRVEQQVTLALDSLDLAPQSLGEIELQQARAFVEITAPPLPPGAGAVVTLDGRPATEARVATCPGTHQLALMLGGQRVYFTTLELKNEETIKVAPVVRPTLALAGKGALPGGASDGWNLLPLEGAAHDAVAAAAEALLAAQEGPAPTAPAFVRGAAPALAEKARAAAPEADLLAVLLPGADPTRRITRVVLVAPREGVAELTSWSEKDAESGPSLVAALHGSGLRLFTPFVGADFVVVRERTIVASVQAGGPAAAAGLRAGMQLLAINGAPEKLPAAFASELPGATPGVPLALHVAFGKDESDVQITPVQAINAPDPGTLRGRMLLGDLATAAALRRGARAEQEMAAGAWTGLLLAALGVPEAAAAALDRADVDKAFDPGRDAQATILWVREQLLRALGRTNAAGEVRTSWQALLPDARLGGRDGIPLRYGATAPAD